MKSDSKLIVGSLFFFFYFKLIKKKTYHLTKRGKCYIIIDACNDAYTIKYRKTKIYTCGRVTVSLINHITQTNEGGVSRGKS